MSEAIVTTNKQAYLIMAYKTDIVFRTLIQMLDHPKNDIFIHMDAKNESYNPAETLKLVKHSRIFHTPRIKVSWGAYSQVEADLLMLEAATSQGKYQHYHLLSNSDLPIKKQDDIIAFFESHGGAEFMTIGETFKNEDRVRYYYPFQEIKGKKGSFLVRVVAKICLLLQKIAHVHRNKGINFRKGTDWCSITDELARHILSKREWIREVFHDTFIPTEQFIHTILINSPLRKNHVNSHMRLIDWKRGRPYTFRMSDLEQIKNSPAMFARKFDADIDAEIITKIQELYS